MKNNTNLKILVIDDSLTMRNIIKSMLIEANYKNISEASDGSVALTMIKDSQAKGNPFELILSDWNMPLMPGIELLKIVRQTKGLEKLPFIMITMEAENTYVNLAVRAGVSEFLIKPFDTKILQHKIDKIMK